MNECLKGVFPAHPCLEQPLLAILPKHSTASCHHLLITLEAPFPCQDHLIHRGGHVASLRPMTPSTLQTILRIRRMSGSWQLVSDSPRVGSQTSAQKTIFRPHYFSRTTYFLCLCISYQLNTNYSLLTLKSFHHNPFHLFCPLSSPLPQGRRWVTKWRQLQRKGKEKKALQIL